MAKDNVEVEVKIPLLPEQLQSIRSKLNEIATAVGTTQQVDEYFTPLHRNFVQPRYPY